MCLREIMSGGRESIIVSVQLSVEFEDVRAFAGWGAFPFTPFLGGGCLPIALEGIQHREPRFFILGC